jgi:hypothetical protein
MFLLFHPSIKCSQPFLNDMRCHQGFVIRFLVSREFLYINVIKTSWFRGLPYNHKFFQLSSHKTTEHNCHPFFAMFSMHMHTRACTRVSFFTTICNNLLVGVRRSISVLLAIFINGWVFCICLFITSFVIQVILKCWWVLLLWLVFRIDCY